MTPVKVNNRSKNLQNRKDQKSKGVSSAPGSVKRIYQTQPNQKTVVNVSQTPSGGGNGGGGGAELAYFQTTPAQSAAQRNEYVRLTQEQNQEQISADTNQENSEAQNALIKRLLGAEKVDLQKSTGKGLPQVSTTQVSKIEHVSISELKTLGISLQQNSEQANSALNSPVSIKSEGSSSSTTPTQLIPTSGVQDVKQELDDKKKIEVKQEFKQEKPNLPQKGARKRKQSVDAKSTKKRKLKQDDTNHTTLPPLSLAEAPIRRNIDSLPPLGGGTIAKLGREWDGLGKNHWIDEWNFGGWIQSSLHFYDAFR